MKLVDVGRQIHQRERPSIRYANFNVKHVLNFNSKHDTNSKPVRTLMLVLILALLTTSDFVFRIKKYIFKDIEPHKKNL